MVEARVILKCMLHEDGSVAPCEVERETPEGQGFGERALELAKRARYNRSGGPGVVRVAMSFPVIDLSDEQSAPLPHTPASSAP